MKDEGYFRTSEKLRAKANEDLAAAQAHIERLNGEAFEMQAKYAQVLGCAARSKGLYERERDLYDKLNTELIGCHSVIERLNNALERVSHTKDEAAASIAILALAIPTSTEALRQHDAELVERIADYVDRNMYSCREYADQIRKGSWK